MKSTRLETGAGDPILVSIDNWFTGKTNTAIIILGM